MNIKKTSNTPKVEINSTEGTLIMIGRTFPEYPEIFYNPIKEVLKNIESNSLHITCEFDYINTSSTKCLLFLFKEMKKVFKEMKITWICEEDDDDLIELGEDFADSLDMSFEMIQIVEH